MKQTNHKNIEEKKQVEVYTKEIIRIIPQLLVFITYKWIKKYGVSFKNKKNKCIYLEELLWYTRHKTPGDVL